MKRLLPIFLLLTLLIATFSACSPYRNPEKYISLPELSSITVKNADVEEALADTLDDLLINMTGEHFTPVTDRNEKVKLGDKVYVTYQGKPTDPTVTLSSAAQKALTASESDYSYIIPGSGLLPEAVENILIGTSVGSDVSVNVTYTEDNTDITDLVGQEISLTMQVVSISRLVITARHAVKLEFTASLADGSEPTEEIKPLLTGAIETTDLADKDDTFNEAFSSAELMPHVLGCHKYQKISFTLTLDAERAANYGYDAPVDIAFDATIKEASETPTAFTDTMVREMTSGQYTTVAAYTDYCREMIKDNLAMQAISQAATYKDDYPEDLYKEFYDENYNEAMYEVLGGSVDFSTEELGNLLSAEVLAQIEEIAVESTLAELRERFLLEYLFQELDITMSDEEYTEKLAELYDTFYINNYYLLLHYGISTPEGLEEYLGKEYIEVQLKYEKLVNMIVDYVSFVD